jgi:hypothetical protein
MSSPLISQPAVGSLPFSVVFTMRSFRSLAVRLAKDGSVKRAGRRKETGKEIADRLNKQNRMYSFPANNKPVYQNWLVALSRLFFACFR